MTSKKKKQILFIVLGIVLLGLSVYAFQNRLLPDAVVGSFFGLSIGFVVIGILPRKEKAKKEVEKES